MRLTPAAGNAVLFVARAATEFEKSDRDPADVVKAVLKHRPDVWVAWHETTPVAVLGVTEPEPGFWQIYCFHTEDFGKVILSLTRFIKRVLVPMLFDERGATRLEGYARPDDHEIRRWMKACGGRMDGERNGRIVYAIDSTNPLL